MNSLIYNPKVKDWECMTDLLMEECGHGKVDMDDSQETPGRGLTTDKGGQTSKEVGQRTMEKQVLTNHFMATLPSPINKYHSDQVKVSSGSCHESDSA